MGRWHAAREAEERVKQKNIGKEQAARSETTEFKTEKMARQRKVGKTEDAWHEEQKSEEDEVKHLSAERKQTEAQVCGVNKEKKDTFISLCSTDFSHICWS